MLNAMTRISCMTLVAALLPGAVLSTDAAGGWRPLFNGRDLTGWQHVGEGRMIVEDGVLRTAGWGVGLLYWTGGTVGHCTIRVVYRTRGDYDRSGVFVRIPLEPRELQMPINYGYLVQIDNHPEFSYEDDYHLTGGLYSFTKPTARAWNPAPAWNTLEITLDGARTIVELNGKRVSDYTEGGPEPGKVLAWDPDRGLRPETGWLALRNQDGKMHTIYFREVSMRPLP